MTVFEFEVAQKHIDIQKNASQTYNGSNLFRGACELPEYHQCDIDPKQKLYQPVGKERVRVADTTHDDYGNCDYKSDSKEGVKLSEFTQKNIENGKINTIVVWKWVNGPKYEYGYLVRPGQKLSYEILGWIDAKEALKLLDKSTGRFKYKKLNVF